MNIDDTILWSAKYRPALLCDDFRNGIRGCCRAAELAPKSSVIMAGIISDFEALIRQITDTGHLNGITSRQRSLAFSAACRAQNLTPAAVSDIIAASYPAPR